MSSQHDTFPVTHSILSTTALMAGLVADYDIGQPVKSVLLTQGLNDTYLIKTDNASYVLRVYRKNWRSLPDILYEIDLLTHLQHEGASVSSAIARRDRSFTRALRAPEGERYAVLFTYADGTPPSYPPTESYARLYGQNVAEIHNWLDGFSSTHRRFVLDLDYLIDRPIQSILPFLTDRPDDAEYLANLAARLKEHVMLLSGKLEYGACHGDFHGGNCHITKENRLTFFDFDCCGPGYRAFELATFRWNTKLHGLDDANWPAFLQGYTSRRPIHDVDLNAVPMFVAIRHIWLLGLHTSNGDDFGYAWLDNNYFDRGLKFLREWEATHLTELGAHAQL